MLEFDALRDLLRGYSGSPLGQARITALEPSADRAWIETQHQLTGEIREFRRVGGHFEFFGLLDVEQMVRKARIEGAALETGEIRDILLVVDRAAEWRQITLSPPATMKIAFESVAELSLQVADFSEFLRGFRNKILPDGTLDDRASPELARIRREIERQRRQIQDSLRGYLRRLSDGGAAQDEVITIRGERFVIPIKVEQKRRVQGVVHGASSSGQTVFVEPLETIEQNNELVRLFDEEQSEIHRILLEMTERIGQRSAEIIAAVNALAELELQFAKARFADDYQCVAVTFPEYTHAPLILHNARHPLLERNLKAKGGRVVPTTIELEGARRQLVITGPNTGGKTVGLKTAGLLALMAQSGVPVPADRADLPLFDAVLADIGDYQSIEQNLSTFSAHVTNIDFISRTATAASLVLLDELGSATDPEEGASSGRRHRRPLPPPRLHQHHLHPPHFAEGLWSQHFWRDQRFCRFRRSHAAAHLRIKDRRARRLRRHQHRTAPGPESLYHRLRPNPPRLTSSRCGRISRPAACRPAGSRSRTPPPESQRGRARAREGPPRLRRT